MNYTFKEWKEVSPTRKKNLKRHHFDQWNFFYAVAENEIQKPEENSKWTSGKSYMARCYRSKNLFWIDAINVNANVKKGEIFICGQVDHLCGVEKATGVMTFKRHKDETFERKASRYLHQLEMRKQRRIYNWYENEKSLIQSEAHKNAREMNENMSIVNLPENKNVEYIINVTTKRIKTQFGLENDSYKENFTILTSPFDMARERICLTEADLKKWKFENHDEVMSFNPKFPLYVIKGDLCTYICEKSDFKLLHNFNEKVEIAYVNKWEDREFELNKKLIAIRRWLNKGLSKIKEDVWANYPELMKA